MTSRRNNHILFRYRQRDTPNGVTRKSVLQAAKALGMDETSLIHRALADFIARHVALGKINIPSSKAAGSEIVSTADMPLDAKQRRAQLRSLADSLAVHERATRDVQRSIFAQIRRVYPDVAKALLMVFGKPDAAGAYLCSRAYALGGKTPLSLIASGKSQDVIDELTRIEGGTCY